ncbi:Ubiquilin-4 [Actinomortierella ambigua]|uniref:Ubiquilin-4 n=1 Tax=Actinomortierella ambigua TaxID=1343610 RepID=A0A9P6Q2M5_9FUNG|nr:Ubiquilin-4 [Actinomortierella ambigua]
MELATSPARSISLTIRPSTGSSFTTSISSDSTVLQLKEQLATAQVPASSIRLVYSGRVLKDEDLLSSYDIQDGHAIHMIKRATNRASQQAVETARQAAPSAPRRIGLGLGGLGGEMNPDLMNILLNNPMVQDMMSNPDVVRRMMMSNPQTRQVMENNPEVAQMINDPAFLRQSLDMARNPNLMQQAMRNNDRAISNLEMIPGGFNHLKRMYHSVQEPMEASRNQPLPSTDELNQRFAAELNADTQPITGTLNTTPLPNPWAPRSQQQGAMNPFAAMMQGNDRFGGLGGRHGGMTRSPFGHPGAGAHPFAGLFGPPPRNPSSAGVTGTDASQAATNPLSAMFGAGARPGATGANTQIPQGRPMNPFAFPELGSPEAFQQVMQFNQFMRQMQQQQQQQGQPNFSGGPSLSPFGIPGFPPVDPAAMAAASRQPPTTATAASASSQTTATTSAPAAPLPPPEERFQTQLAALRDMGFSDDNRNVRALLASGGNVDSAVEWLLRM